MPDITLPPVLIDSSPQESSQQSSPRPYFQGPFKTATGLYSVLWTSVGPPRTFNVFRSTDGGLTWAQQDTANSPLYDQSLGLCSMQAKLVGTNIVIMYNPTASQAPAVVRTILFNTTNQRFVTGTAPDFSDTAPGLLQFDFTVRNNGDVLLAYQRVNAPNVLDTDMGFVLLSGGAWGAYQVVAAGNDGTHIGYAVPALVTDPATNIVHFFYRQEVGSPPVEDNTWYAQVSPGNVISGQQEISTDGISTRLNYGQPILWNGSAVLPVYNTIGGGVNFTAFVLVGTPLSTPTFTRTDLDAGGTQIFDTAGCQAFVDTNGTLWVAWIYWPDSTAIQIKRVTNQGSGFGSTEILYDAIANPPNSLPAAQQGIFALTAAAIGSFGVVITVNDAADFVVLSYFLHGGVSSMGKQIIFKGVRRIKGTPDRCADGAPKTFTYVRSVALTLNQTTTLAIPINDYPFELYQLILLAENGGVISGITSPIAALWVYDRNKVQISNIPVLDVFLDGGPNGLYREGALSPPLCYPKDSSLKIDVTGLVTGQNLIIHAVGRRIYPC